MSVLVLPRIIDRRGAVDLSRLLLERRGSDLTLDARGVERIGGLGAEVLVAADRQWRMDGVRLTVPVWPEAVQSALATLGLDPAFLVTEG